MNYSDYYLTLRDSADKIAAGEDISSARPQGRPDIVHSSKKPQSRPFVPRPEFKDKPEEAGSVRPPPQEDKNSAMINHYFNQVRAMGGQVGAPVEGDPDRVLQAIAAIESRGSGDYAALGPVIDNENSMYYGDRAYGKYQVMGRNIPEWTKKALGKSMTKEEFLASEEAQDAVAKSRLTDAYEKHGSWEDAASVWFSGGPLADRRGRSDGGNTVEQYVSKFQKEMMKNGL